MKLNNPSAGRNSGGSAYSAVSSSLTNPFPDSSNYSPFATFTTSLRINTSLVSSDQTLYQAAPPETIILHCCNALLQNLVGNSGEMQCLEEAEHQAVASTNVPYPPLQIINSVPFCLFSLYLCPLSISWTHLLLCVLFPPRVSEQGM